MNNVISSKLFIGDSIRREKTGGIVTNLAEASINKEYVIKDIVTDDDELKNFLFTLGCYAGETVTVISVLAENFVITVKDARYSIDKDLAEAIII